MIFTELQSRKLNLIDRKAMCMHGINHCSCVVQQFQPRVANFGVACTIHLNGCKGKGPTASCLELLLLLIWSFFMQISSKKNPNCVVISIFGMEYVVRNRRSPKCFQGSVSSFGSTPHTNQTQTSFNSSST